MQTVLVGLAAGLMVGVICIFYVFLRTKILVAAKIAAQQGSQSSQEVSYAEQPTSSTFMFIAFIASGSLLWGFIGAGIYHLIRDDLYFFILSVVLALIVNVKIWISKTTYAKDKMVVTLVILLGLGVLIPWLI